MILIPPLIASTVARLLALNRPATTPSVPNKPLSPPDLSVPTNLSTERRKLRILIQDNNGLPREVIFHPKNLSPNKRFIHFGNYRSDQFHAWLPIDQIRILDVLDHMQDGDAPTLP
jgi:hypothetical protein